MHSMTLEQLRAANVAGGIENVTLKGDGAAFLVEIATRRGRAVLSKARSTEPRRFGNLASALHVLIDIGITTGVFDAGAWDPEAKVPTAGNRGRGEAMREAHQARAHNEWLRAEIASSLDEDGRNVPLDEGIEQLLSGISPRAEAEPKSPRRG